MQACPAAAAVSGTVAAAAAAAASASAAAASLPPALPAPATCRDDIASGMFKSDPPSKQGLVASYSFLPENVDKSADGKVGGRQMWRQFGGSMLRCVTVVRLSTTFAFWRRVLAPPASEFVLPCTPSLTASRAAYATAWAPTRCSWAPTRPPGNTPRLPWRRQTASLWHLPPPAALATPCTSATNRWVPFKPCG